MHLQRVEIQNVRNLQDIQLTFSSNINIFLGENGSGKTSFLEALHILAVGRSFRSHLIKRVVNHQKQKLSVFGAIVSDDQRRIPVGIEKQNDGDTKIRVANKVITSLAELASLLPLLIINTDSFDLLTAGPKLRRQFLDWGLFHVEQGFFSVWKKYNEVLRQRNAALKMNPTDSYLKTWDNLLIEPALQLDALRKQFMQQFQTVFEPLLEKLIDPISVTLNYLSGWPQGQNLEQLLEDSRDRDRLLGYTHYGPHRADIAIKVNGTPAQDILSRGQQKLLITALLLTQGKLLQLCNKNSLYLVDDISSELDCNSLNKILDVLLELKGQLFITAIDKEGIKKVFDQENVKLFHVKHGLIEEYI